MDLKDEESHEIKKKKVKKGRKCDGGFEVKRKDTKWRTRKGKKKKGGKNGN